MSSKINQSVCLNHPNVPAVAHCATCRKPICEKCIKTANGIICCSDACLQNALDSQVVVGEIMARKKKSELKRVIRNFILLLIVLAAAWFAYQHRQALQNLLQRGKSKTEQVGKEVTGQVKSKSETFKHDLEEGDARRRAANDKKYGFDQ